MNTPLISSELWRVLSLQGVVYVSVIRRYGLLGNSDMHRVDDSLLHATSRIGENGLS